ncbi:hypothetical protein SNEBB_009632 [Seison nebaliae]|nr:hypothetical protein SNEBB_009632 [Seison nebaliae]
MFSISFLFLSFVLLKSSMTDEIGNFQFDLDNMDLKVTDCHGTKFPKVDLKGVAVNDCKAFPCQLKDESFSEIRIVYQVKIKPGRQIPVARNKIYGKIAGQWTQFDLAEESIDVCKLGNNCPMKSGDVVDFKTKIFIKPRYKLATRGKPVDIKWKIVNHKKRELVCFKFSAIIV